MQEQVSVGCVNVVVALQVVDHTVVGWLHFPVLVMELVMLVGGDLFTDDVGNLNMRAVSVEVVSLIGLVMVMLKLNLSSEMVGGVDWLVVVKGLLVRPVDVASVPGVVWLLLNGLLDEESSVVGSMVLNMVSWGLVANLSHVGLLWMVDVTMAVDVVVGVVTVGSVEHLVVSDLTDDWVEVLSMVGVVVWEVHSVVDLVLLVVVWGHISLAVITVVKLLVVLVMDSVLNINVWGLMVIWVDDIWV